MQMSVGSRAMVYAYQHQHRIERNRGESIRRHAMDFAILVNSDDRDPGRETSHRLAEIVCVKAHAKNRPLTTAF